MVKKTFYFFVLTIKLRHFSFIRRFYFGESRTSNIFIFFLLSHSSFHLYNFILPRELRWNRNFLINSVAERDFRWNTFSLMLAISFRVSFGKRKEFLKKFHFISLLTAFGLIKELILFNKASEMFLWWKSKNFLLLLCPLGDFCMIY